MSFHAGQTFVYGEQPSATKMQYIWDNDYALADGSGISDSAIKNRHVADANITPAKLASAARWWEKLGSTYLNSPSDTIDVGTFTAKKYLRVVFSLFDTGGTITGQMRFGNAGSIDTGNNYAMRYSTNGAADTTSTGNSGLSTDSSSGAQRQFSKYTILNIAAQEKLIIGSASGNNGAGATLPNRREFVGKWVNTSNQITDVRVFNGGAGDFAVGSFVEVYGHD